MTEKFYYRAFGLTICSCISIPQIQQISPCQTDITIIRSDLSDMSTAQSELVSDDGIHVFTESNTRFRVSNGTLIEADIEPDATDSYVGIYLMGSCMGAILIQRGFMLLHGSCVTDGTRSILISGDSGAGKSTLAAEFLKQGWKLVTDDVTCVFEQDAIPTVRSSYPSQKLWHDAMQRYEHSDTDIHSLFTTGNREKFGVNVADSFYDGVCELSMMVRLLPADRPCYVGAIEGIAKVDQLLRNSYRAYFIAEKDRQRHFQRCVTLSTKIPMALAIRENGTQCADTLYDMITDYLGGI